MRRNKTSSFCYSQAKACLLLWMNKYNKKDYDICIDDIISKKDYKCFNIHKVDI